MAVAEREYVIPLRREWMKVPEYKRTAKGVKTIKEFIVRHMNIRDRDTKKVKLDMYLNNELWFRGKKSPPAKIKVKARRDGDVVRVEFVSAPEHVGFAQKRHERRHKKVEKAKVPAKTEEEPKDEKTDAEKKDESEKAKSVAEANVKLAEQAAKAQKHTVKGKEPVVQRKALQK